MVRKNLIVCGIGVILLSSILAPAAKASKDSAAEPAPLQTEPVYFSLAGGLYSTPQVLNLTDSQAGAVIYYTTTPNTPVSTWSVYNPASPIIVKSTETITAIAQAPGYSLSGESAKSYRYTPAPQAAAPYFSLAGGIYTTPQTLTLTSSTPNASFCYTTNGKSPLDANGMKASYCTKYTGPIAVNQSELLQAVTIAPGFNLSAVDNKQYLFPPDSGSPDSLLGVVESAVSFCNSISAGSMPGYAQMDQLFISGQSQQTLSQVRSSSDYQTAYNEVSQLFQALTRSEALAQCTSH